MRTSGASIGVAVLIVVAAALSPAHAQEAREPFDRLDVSLHGVADVGNGDYHDSWDAGRGLSFEAATPFYTGSLSALARFIHNDTATGTGTPSTTSWGLWAGWWLGRDVSNAVRVSLGASLGITQWHFPDEENEELLHESEVGIEAGARVGWSITPRWGVAVTGSLQRTYTHDRIDLGLVSIGVTRTFGMPAWLRGGLE